MRSIPVAMIWETLQRGRWNLILGLLAANLLPIIIYSAFGPMGVIELDEYANRVMHSTLVQLNMFLFGSAILFSQGTPSRLYAFPVATSTIVAWQMIPAMVLVGTEMLLSTAFLNAVFHLGWPQWGPALFVAATLGAYQATLWYTEKSAWLALAMTVVTGGLGYWYLARFSPILSHSRRPILDIEAIEVVLLLMMAIASYCLGVAGVARNRYGEQIKPLGIVAWLTRLLDLDPVLSPPFRSPAAAQYWLEWTLKGWCLPIVVVFGIPVSIVIWLFASRTPKDLFEGFVLGGAMMSVPGMVIGMIIGNSGPADSNLQMGHFAATRPLTSTSMAFTILKVAAKSVLIAWTIWLAALAILTGILLLAGVAPQPLLPRDIRWWYFPVTLLGCWTIVSVVASMVLAGRGKGLVQQFCCLMALYIGLVIYAEFALSWDTRLRLFRGLTIALGIGLILGCGYLFIAGRRRRLIGLPTVATGVVVWAALSSIIIFEWSRNQNEPPSTYVLVVGLAALAVVPLAAAPLALAWNRNR